MLERSAAAGAALADELRTVLPLVEELVSALGDDRDAAIMALRARAADTLQIAKSHLAEFERQAQRAGRRASVAADAYVRDNPWTVVSAGAAIGLLLGAALCTRSS
ncbi:MAG TPA: hypothetical protein VJQ47_02870 [Steroidobacteraceae bacterium]|nr:hypothetical protein [Steroidobacteraceae bacterium]